MNYISITRDPSVPLLRAYAPRFDDRYRAHARAGMQRRGFCRLARTAKSEEAREPREARVRSEIRGVSGGYRRDYALRAKTRRGVDRSRRRVCNQSLIKRRS